MLPTGPSSYTPLLFYLLCLAPRGRAGSGLFLRWRWNDQSPTVFAILCTTLVASVVLTAPSDLKCYVSVRRNYRQHRVAIVFQINVCKHSPEQLQAAVALDRLRSNLSQHRVGRLPLRAPLSSRCWALSNVTACRKHKDACEPISETRSLRSPGLTLDSRLGQDERLSVELGQTGLA